MPARMRGPVTTGSMVRTIRELQEMTQSELAQASGLTQSTVSGIESDRLALGVDRAKRLALALRTHPSVLLFADWEREAEEMKRAG